MPNNPASHQEIYETYKVIAGTSDNTDTDITTTAIITPLNK